MTPEEKKEQADELYDEEKFEEALSLYLEAANEGCADAMYNAAVILLYGTGCEPDHKKALYWARRCFAETPEDEDSARLLRLCEATSSADQALSEERYDDAVPFLRTAADLGSGAAANLLISLYAQGRSDLISPEEVFAGAQQAADAGYVYAMVILADCYANGIGTEQDLSEAARLARTILDDGTCPEDLCEHAHLLLEWIQDRPDPEELNRAGCDLINEGRPEEAFQAFQTAANMGNSCAMNNVSICYKTGVFVEADDRQAFLWKEKAAEAGYLPAFCDLADLYAKGIGTEKDYDKALYWAGRTLDEDTDEDRRKDAKQTMDLIPYLRSQDELLNDPVAKARADRELFQQLAVMWHEQAVIARNEGRLEDAFGFFKQAAEAGLVESFQPLANMYRLGSGTAVDPGLAKYWAELAMRTDSDPARRNMINEDLKWLCAVIPSRVPADQLPQGFRLFNAGRYPEAIPHLEAEGRKGDAPSLLMLGYMYYYGLGLPKDYDAAFRFCCAAAFRGDRYAQDLLARGWRSNSSTAAWKINAYIKNLPFSENYLSETAFLQGFPILDRGIEKQLESIRTHKITNRTFYDSDYLEAAKYGLPDALCAFTGARAAREPDGRLKPWVLYQWKTAAMLGCTAALTSLAEEYDRRGFYDAATKCYQEAARRGHKQAAMICANRS